MEEHKLYSLRLESFTIAKDILTTQSTHLGARPPSTEAIEAEAKKIAKFIFGLNG